MRGLGGGGRPGFGGSFLNRIVWNMPWIDFGVSVISGSPASRHITTQLGSALDAANLWQKGEFVSSFGGLLEPTPQLALRATTVGAPVPPAAAEVSGSAFRFGFNPRHRNRFGLYAMVAGLRVNGETGAPAGSMRFGLVTRNPSTQTWVEHAHAVFVDPTGGTGAGNTVLADAWDWDVRAGGVTVANRAIQINVGPRPPLFTGTAQGGPEGDLLEVLLLPPRGTATFGRAIFFRNGAQVAMLAPGSWDDFNTSSSGWVPILQFVNRIDETTARIVLHQIGCYTIDATGL